MSLLFRQVVISAFIALAVGATASSANAACTKGTAAAVEAARAALAKTEGVADATSCLIEAVVALLLLRGEAVTPGQRIAVCRHPRDNKFLEVAVSGQADVIVSGDEDLLTLDSFAGIPIVPSARFLSMLDESLTRS